MSPTAREQADAASDAYTNHQGYLHDNKPVYLGGSEYKIIGYRNDSATGFHATAYQSVATHEIIIAYRGTDPAIKDITGHTLTTVQDIAVDATMVRDRVNPQETAASDFTREIIARAKMQGISTNQITVAGHSLGGTLAEIEAYKYDLGGATFNAYGAASLDCGVPEGGGRVIDYVMAGDVVSAASHHNGRVVTLASQEDLESMRSGRYLDAPAGAQAPNPFLAMSLGDHSIKHFAPGPGDRTTSVLDPGTLTQYEKNYADNKAAIDAYRNDVYRERGELSVALRQGAHAQLPPDVRQQLDEYLTVNVDPAIRRKIEQNSVVQGAEHGLQTGADALRTVSQHAQSQYERMAAAAHAAGNTAGPVDPIAPVAGAVIGEAAHLQGRAASAVGSLAANGLEAARQTIEHGAHDAAGAVNGTIHNPATQATALHLVNGVVDTYRTAEAAAHTAGQAYDHARRSVSHGIDAAKHTAEKAYDDTRQAVSHGIDAAGHAATQAYGNARQVVSHGIDDARHTAVRVYDDTRQAMTHGIETVTHAASKAFDTLTHAESSIGHGAPPSPASQPLHSRANPTAESPYTRDDPRHAANPDHALYQELHERIPAASEKRLLQFTAACHAGGITRDNIGPIAYDENRGIMHFMATSELRPPVAVDVKAPSPDPQHSIQQIQLANQLRPQAQAPAQGTQIGQ